MAARFKLDPYVASIALTAGLAALVPARGQAAAVLDGVVTVAITLVFFLYGAKLPTARALAGLRRWRPQVAIVVLTFGLFPLLALVCAPLVPAVLDARLYAGVVFLCALPSTVQSSVTLTGIARGDEATAICAASLSNVLGVVLTPLLTALLLATGGGAAGSPLDSLGGIVLRLLLPFLLGQLAQRWIGDRVRAHGKRLGLFDRGVILLVVYAAFSQGIVAGVWHRLEPSRLAVLLLVVAALLAAALGAARVLARRLGLSREDRVAVLFCGSQKSLASGLPMASVLFAGGDVGLIVLPLMLYHQLQLLVCAWIAQRSAAAVPAPAAEPVPAPA
ncbi:bile acid:sodium symporter family protein [Actinomadura hibisca]|uniref:bile acid:sodium symporter family protein n=1 Tax=Actinomadura hibisca TaxID=68565 RepID=UPI00082AFB10|nr:bile acid:sodium symporter family protein [Actinomadura hibisca]